MSPSATTIRIVTATDAPEPPAEESPERRPLDTPREGQTGDGPGRPSREVGELGRQLRDPTVREGEPGTSRPRAWVVTPEKFLTDPEYDRLLAHVRERRDAALLRGATMAVRDAALVILLAKSGLRVGEACELVWSDLQLRSADGRPPAVLVRHGKGNKTRLVPIGEELRRELRDWQRAAEAREVGVGLEDPVFGSQRGGKLTVSGAERIVGNAMRRAGIPGKANPHRLRHSYASRLYRATRDLRLVQKVLGHSRVDTTTVYAGLFDPDVTAGVNAV